MLILDTDHMSLLQRGGTEGERIRSHLRSMPLDDVATTVVTYEEQTRGWLARLARMTTLEQQVLNYAEVKKLVRDYCYLTVLDFDTNAADELRKLQSAKIRAGTMDLKIAAFTLAQNATLLTRSTTHFGRVPGLFIEDWAS